MAATKLNQDNFDSYREYQKAIDKYAGKTYHIEKNNHEKKINLTIQDIMKNPLKFKVFLEVLQH